MTRRTLYVFGAMLLLLAALWFKGAPLALPEVRQANAPGAFDTQRAMARLQRLLAEERPHSTDTPANDVVRERLVAELRAIGLTPRVQDTMTCNGKADSRTISCARIRNVTATIGPANGRHVLFVSHYDSVSAGPGASDDGIGVAVMLETAALLRGQRLSRPITFLFDEGEEGGLIGARAFLDADPLAARVDTLVNFESRGVEGPAIMFETSRPNGSAIAPFAASARRPVANSLTTDFYRMIPNSTDVAVFEERGWTILNFAVIGNETRYHSGGDSLAALDRRSVQHMGDQAASLARTLTTGPAVARGGGERLYTDVAGRFLVVLPMLAGLLLLGGLILFFAWSAWRRRGGIGLAFASVAASLVDAVVLAFAGQWVIAASRSGDYWRAYPEYTGLAVYASALLACLSGLALARRATREQLRSAFWLLFLLIGAGISFAAPGAAILFLLPPLVMAIGMVAERFVRGAEWIAAIAAALLLFLTFGPLLELIETLLKHGSAWTFAPLAATILLPALIELRALFEGVRLRTVVAGGAPLAIAAWVLVGLVPAYSEDRQQLFTIEYLWDADARQGQWLIDNDGAPLPDGFRAAAGDWRRRGDVPYTSRARWAAVAPALPVTPPGVTMVAQREVPQGRLVTMRLASGGNGVVTLQGPQEAQLLAIRAGGRSRQFGNSRENGGRYTLRCRGRSCDGMNFDLLLGSREPVVWTLIGGGAPLPAAAQPLVAARPRLARPQYNADGAYVIAHARF